ncbi:MAG TPA: hypothetical protein VEB69_09020 [Acidimicrobiia bacterium]|nr:hypothetical protein [Acidimicrobiia bacterium]
MSVVSSSARSVTAIGVMSGLVGLVLGLGGTAWVLGMSHPNLAVLSLTASAAVSSMIVVYGVIRLRRVPQSKGARRLVLLGSVVVAGLTVGLFMLITQQA